MEIKSWVLRLFAVSWGALLALAAYLLAASTCRWWLWSWLLVGVVLCVAGFFRPQLMCGPYRMVERALAPVGHLFSLLLLSLFFFGVFAPYAVILRWRGWDPLRIKGANRSPSAWVERPDASISSGYRWQY